MADALPRDAAAAAVPRQQDKMAPAAPAAAPAARADPPGPNNKRATAPCPDVDAAQDQRAKRRRMADGGDDQQEQRTPNSDTNSKADELQTNEHLDLSAVVGSQQQQAAAAATGPAAPGAGASEEALIVSLDALVGLDNNEDIAKAMVKREEAYQPAASYMDQQSEIDAQMRAVLLDWMVEVAQEFFLGRETLHSAMNMVDRYLSVVPNLARSRLQLLGTACLFLASKVEEIYPPKATDFAITTDGAYPVTDIYAMEREVLAALKWRLLPPTSYSWLKMYVKVAACRINASDSPGKDVLLRRVCSVPTFTSVMALLDMALHHMTAVCFYPSALAMAAMYVVVPEIEPMLHDISGYSVEALTPCADFLRHFSVLQPRPVPASSKRYVEVHVFAEDMYTRQTHHPGMLDLFKSLFCHPPAGDQAQPKQAEMPAPR